MREDGLRGSTAVRTRAAEGDARGNVESSIPDTTWEYKV
jgi:hypothetical protein